MPAHWSIEDGQAIPLTQFTGEDNPVMRGLVFATDGNNTHNQLLTLVCADDVTYTLVFNKNGVPQGPAIKHEPPPPAKEEAAA
jgi:hypothetical protein